ncbi:MAG: GtrA family protein [Lachnospiraceae bacterium]
MIQKIKEYYTKYRELIVYLIVGVLTTVVSWITYAICTLIMNVDNPVIMQIAVVIRWVAGVVFAYFTNRAFVFRSKNPNMLKEAISFTSSRVVTLFLDMFVMWFLPTIYHVDDWIATFVSAVLVTITNYIFSKFIVFRKKQSK